MVSVHLGGGKKKNILWFFRNLFKMSFGPGCADLSFDTNQLFTRIAMGGMKPLLRTPIRRILILLPIMLGTTILFLSLSLSDSMGAQNGQTQSGDNDIIIYQIAPDIRGGKAYKLVYLVKSPIDFYWKFKTDFDNDFLVGNKYIREHHFISQTGNTVITENKYTSGPDVYFRWQTTVFPQARRLEFVLLNPEHCRQKFHYGHIQLESTSEGTRVTQVAYFDFWGVSLWANYPWVGGMKDFLSYTVRWEQETLLNLRDRYDDENTK